MLPPVAEVRVKSAAEAVKPAGKKRPAAKKTKTKR